MAADTIFVLGLLMVFVGWIGYIAIHSRRAHSRVMGAEAVGDKDPKPGT